MSYNITKLTFKIIDLGAIVLAPIYLVLSLVLRFGKALYETVVLESGNIR